ncbi:hypothetical protein, partial [Pyrobaculum sp.]|uniref:hypothetical protein n=1 Tax=Pyrobaculum sp. TaxID=2004705 RepID=UPI003D0E394D
PPPDQSEINVVNYSHIKKRALKPTTAFNPPIYIFPDLKPYKLPESGKAYDNKSGKRLTYLSGVKK